MANIPPMLARREFIALLGGAAAVLVVGDGLSLAASEPQAHAQANQASWADALSKPAESAANIQSSLGAEPTTPPQSLDDLPWNLRLINREHPLPEGFLPESLAEPPEASWVEEGRGAAVDARIVDDLAAMLDAAEADGAHPVICSSYRTNDYQQSLFDSRVERVEEEEGLEGAAAEEAAAFWVAPPGASEHQAGLAVDIVDADYSELDEGQETTAAQQWLIAHCAEYGFILRYPTDKSAVTGIGYEPWHYRYVGREAASDITESGLCFEEWLVERYNIQG
ncbi:M15 family metallopeptidase [Adlercreutzia sp. R25]|uniref:M15 family metallopeptidase n=1 Tax=Adlercreutzia shanghongiae TaxID=3111773 RepID=A0ABU6IZ10_9ACTN|nr:MULTISPECIES: M15 family metallopeptidase [unclassified Adlercreutzia]MEC4272775.1 M15 family metallopeptidase [Adlercreutzia sp. R25]MEC4295107.1 M15 family metallopeptidase [Adlercreutzia sp. R22]